MSAATSFCTFWLDGQLFGIAVEAVREVVRDQPVTPVPRAPAAVRGLVNLRGRIVAAVDLRRCLDPGAPDGRGDRRAGSLVVLKSSLGEVSLVVDEVRDVCVTTPETFEGPPSTLRGPGRDLILGTHKLEDRLLLVLDVPRTIEAAGA